MRILTTFAILALACSATAGGTIDCDVFVYGMTPAGITASITARRAGLNVMAVEPSDRIGGLTTGGLGQTDIGAKRCYTGLARQFYRDVKAWYADPAHWTREKAATFKGDGWHCWEDLPSDADTMWVFEPSVALTILRGWLAREGVAVTYRTRLDRVAGATRKDAVTRAITSVRLENGDVVRARFFIDATYEGDLMASAGVPYHVGREDNLVYGETVNGVRTADSDKHQFAKGVDPYVRKGDPASGLLPGIDPRPLEAPGTGDRRVQAYCYRLCLTDDPANRVPYPKPADYDERTYELLFRDLEAGGTNQIAYFTCPMPNRKTDANSAGGVGFDLPGGSWDYPDASYAERERIASRHRSWQMGLLWTLANHPRVPAAIRAEHARWGLAGDEFVETGHWPRQLYVREARRMIGEYVVTEADCRGQRVAPKPHVATGSYGMDSHHCRRVAVNGQMRNEGDLQDYRKLVLYPIPLAAMRPKAKDCTNLLVPVCLSASHAAFGSIRMEPNFFQLGEAAGQEAVRVLKDQQVKD